jgi:hypothetical protein
MPEICPIHHSPLRGWSGGMWFNINPFAKAKSRSLSKVAAGKCKFHG